jgi:hypothetical protein
MSSTGIVKSANNAATATAAIASTNSTAATMRSRVIGGLTGKWGIGFSGLTAISLLIAAVVTMSQFVGSKDDWNLIQPQIGNILTLTLIGTACLTVSALLYFTQDSARAIYFILVMVCVSLGLSFSAVAIAAISR